MRTIGLLFKVLWSPGETMFLLSKTPRVLVPLVLLCLVSAVAGGVMVTKVDLAELTIRQIEHSTAGATFPEAQKDLMRQQLSSPAAKAGTFLSTAISPLLILLVVTGIYFAIFTILGRQGGFKSFFSITAFAFVPLIFRQLALIISAFVVPASALRADELGSISPAVFLDRDSMSNIAFAAVNMIDLVTIWILILLVIGYGFVTRKTLSKTARIGAVVGVFLVYAVFRLAIATRGF